jgi:hypothetical protein
MRRLLLLGCLLALCLAEFGCKKEEPPQPTQPPPASRLKKPVGVK